MSEFANKLKGLRKSHQLTQRELAHRLKISPSAVGMYEQGRREPDSDLLMRIGRLFSVSTDYLLKEGNTTPCEVSAVLDSLREQMLQGGLMFHGVPLGEADTEKLFDAMAVAANIMLKDKKEENEKQDH